MKAVESPSLDLSLIGEADIRILSSVFLDAVQRFYEDPKNRERFEQWKEKRNANKTE